MLSGTLTLGQQRRGAGAAPATTPFSFLPLPAAPKKEETKAAGSSKPKPAEQRVSLGTCLLVTRPLKLLLIVACPMSDSIHQKAVVYNITPLPCDYSLTLP